MSADPPTSWPMMTFVAACGDRFASNGPHLTIDAVDEPIEDLHVRNYRRPELSVRGERYILLSQHERHYTLIHHFAYDDSVHELSGHTVLYDERRHLVARAALQRHRLLTVLALIAGFAMPFFIALPHKWQDRLRGFIVPGVFWLAIALEIGFVLTALMAAIRHHSIFSMLLVMTLAADVVARLAARFEEPPRFPGFGEVIVAAIEAVVQYTNLSRLTGQMNAELAQQFNVVHVQPAASATGHDFLLDAQRESAQQLVPTLAADALEPLVQAGVHQQEDEAPLQSLDPTFVVPMEVESPLDAAIPWPDNAPVEPSHELGLPLDADGHPIDVPAEQHWPRRKPE